MCPFPWFGTGEHLPKPPFWKPPFSICEPPKIGWVGGTVRAVPVSIRTVPGETGVSEFQHLKRERSGSSFGFWKMGSAVLVLLSVPGKNGSGGSGFWFRLGSWAFVKNIWKWPDLRIKNNSVFKDASRRLLTQHQPKGQTTTTQNAHLMQHLYGADVVSLLCGEVETLL